jgi:hypothetical protein
LASCSRTSAWARSPTAARPLRPRLGWNKAISRLGLKG